MGIFDAPQARAPVVPLLVVLSCTAPLPFASVLARPGGLVGRTLLALIPNAVSEVQLVAALAGFYVFMAYIFTAGLSIMGQTMGNKEGYANAEPRIAKAGLRGLAHRLTASHQNLLETFPAFAVCAAITLVLPSSELETELSEKSRNYLALHVFMMTCVYVPTYVANLDNLRSFGHSLATASLLGLLIGVARGHIG